MNAFRMLPLACACLIVASAPAFAQLPPPPVPVPVPGQSNNGQRMPDNTVEGIIFEYSGTLDPASKGKGEEKPLEGRFRLEKTAIFDLSPTMRLPTKAEVEKVVESVKAGDPGKVKLPEKPQQRRLGQFQKTGSGRLRLDFDNKEVMVGTMLLFKEKGNMDVWVGTFTERTDGRAGRVWKIKARPVED
jgi:hypothetical protein